MHGCPTTLSTTGGARSGADAPSITPGVVEITAGLLTIALVHTFSTHYFERLAHINPAHAGLWHLLGEVEVVFGFWAMVLLLFLMLHSGTGQTLHYLESRNFTEPAFVFVIMVIAASRPIIDFAGLVLDFLSRILPTERPVAYYFTVLSVGPLLGSFITEPAAMTLAALLLRERFLGETRRRTSCTSPSACCSSTSRLAARLRPSPHRRFSWLQKSGASTWPPC